MAKHERGKSFSGRGRGGGEDSYHTYSNPEYVELPDGVVTVRGAYDHLLPITPLVANYVAHLEGNNNTFYLFFRGNHLLHF